MTKKYTGKWPNCKNIRCFNGVTLLEARRECLSNPSCNGFSVAGGIIQGPVNGCYKTSCKEDSWNGYESGPDDYWAKEPKDTTVKSQRQLALLGGGANCDHQGTCIEKKYEQKWPNCENLYCFSNTDLNDAKAGMSRAMPRHAVPGPRHVVSEVLALTEDRY